VHGTIDNNVPFTLLRSQCRPTYLRLKPRPPNKRQYYNHSAGRWDGRAPTGTCLQFHQTTYYQPKWIIANLRGHPPDSDFTGATDVKPGVHVQFSLTATSMLKRVTLSTRLV
jgi:hypothetical protein